MTVVTNTSPLNYLVQIGEAETLATLCGNIHIPATVRAELMATEAPPEVRRWISGTHCADWAARTFTLRPS